MREKKDFSLPNCIATAMVAYFCMVPLHELFHLLTYYAYGEKCSQISAFSVSSLDTVDFMTLSPFHRIMATGGSALQADLVSQLPQYGEHCKDIPSSHHGTEPKADGKLHRWHSG